MSQPFSNANVNKYHDSPKLALLPLIALVFYSVSGGPFGVEDSIKAGGSLLAILGFLIFPLFWSVPEALITAELSTAFPVNGGYVAWISAAFGPFWAFHGGFWKWISGVIDNALFSSSTTGSSTIRFSSSTTSSTRSQCSQPGGLTVVGYTAVTLAVFSLVPFILMGMISVPMLKPRRWLVVDISTVDWRGYFNNLFWNLNFWDKASTLAGEVDKPGETFPKALHLSIVLVVSVYVIPILAGTGALPLERSRWEDGYFAVVGMAIGGSWLRTWIQAAAALSNMGLFEAEMSSDSFQLLGMAEQGMLPVLFTYRSRFGTPVWGIVFSAFGVLMLSWMSFQEIVEILNFLYSFGMLLELAAFVKLRMSKSEFPRPYKAPVSDRIGSVLLCTPPAILVILVMTFASLQTVVISLTAVLAGLGVQGGLHLARTRNWLAFQENSQETV